MPANLAALDAEVDPAVFAALDRHERRRAAGSPTVSVLVGASESAVRSARRWSERRGAGLVVLADAGRLNLESIASAWTEHLARRCDLADVAGDWLSGLRADSRNPAIRVPVRGRSGYELSLLLGDDLAMETATGVETACRFLLERDCSGRSLDPARLAAELDAAFGDRGRPWLRVLVALAELVPDLVQPGLLWTSTVTNEIGSAARLLADLASAQPRLTVVLTVEPGPFHDYLDRAPESRAKALVRESAIEVVDRPPALRPVLAAVATPLRDLEPPRRSEEPPPAPPDYRGRVQLPSSNPSPLYSGGTEGGSIGLDAVCNPYDDPSRDDARSAAERYLFECLEAHPETKGLFTLNGPAGFRFGPNRQAEVDLIAESLKIAVEIDGYHHFLDPEAYRRDRRKDVEFQKYGYFVVRVLAEDVVPRLEEVLGRIVSAVRFRRGEVELGRPREGCDVSDLSEPGA